MLSDVSSTHPDHASGWREIGPGCFTRRYPSYDLSVGVVAGSSGLLVVDTRADLAEGRQLLGDLASLPHGLGDRPPRWVANTHAHIDHYGGNQAFPEAEIIAHETVPDQVEAATRPGRTFHSVTVVDLGDRIVEIVHPGPGHTDGDAVVCVPDAGVYYLGDVVEESGPPAYGADCFPLEWSASVDIVVGLLPTDAVVVPGHGALVDREFVRDQGHDIGQVAETIADLAGRAVPVDGALDAAEWPFPREGLAEAVRRGYAQLGHAPSSGSSPGHAGQGRELPLIDPS